MLCSIIFIFCFTACGKTNAPELTKSMIEEGLDLSLKGSNYSYDLISSLEFAEVEPSTADMDKLKDTFSKPVPYKKIKTKFKLTSLERDVSGEWSLLYAYANGSWKIIDDYSENLDSWVYEAKETVNNNRIRSDLKTVKFPGFEDGYVGHEATTQIQIEKRNTNAKLSKDNILLTAIVQTEFARYKIGVDLTYVFEGGSWKLADSRVDDPSFWPKPEYITERIPDAPKTETILNELTDESRWLTYVANPAYMQSNNLVVIDKLSSVNSITFQYDFITTYKDFGRITYLVQVPNDWVGGEWLIGDMTKVVKDIDLSNICGVWTANNGDYIQFTKVEQDPQKKYPSKAVAVGTYHKVSKDGAESLYNFKMQLDVPFRADNWDGNVIHWEAANTNSIEYTLHHFTVRPSNNTLVMYASRADGSIPAEPVFEMGDLEFKKTVDDSEIGVEGDIPGQETPTTPVEVPETTAPTVPETVPPTEEETHPAETTPETVPPVVGG